MDLTHLSIKNRLDYIESKIEELRLELLSEENLDSQIENVRREIKFVKQDEDFFREMKNTGMIKSDNLLPVLDQMRCQAQIRFGQANLYKVKNDPEYCELEKEYNIWNTHLYTGAKYQREAVERHEKLTKKLEQLELKKLQLAYCPK